MELRRTQIKPRKQHEGMYIVIHLMLINGSIPSNNESLLISILIENTVFYFCLVHVKICGYCFKSEINLNLMICTGLYE